MAETYEALAPPLFVKDLSVGDVIVADFDEQEDGEGVVKSWRHVTRSRRSTVWLLRLQQTDQIDEALAGLRALGCESVGLPSCGSYSVDVPEHVAMEKVDAVLDGLDSALVGVAFPALRHAD